MRISKKACHHGRAKPIKLAMNSHGVCARAAKNAKVKFPEVYAEWVVCVAGFHEHAHCAFTINEMYFEKYLSYCYDLVGCVASHLSLCEQKDTSH